MSNFKNMASATTLFLLLMSDCLSVIFILTYGLAFIGIIVAAVTTALASNGGWGLLLYRLARERSVGHLPGTITLCSVLLLAGLCCHIWLPQDGLEILILIFVYLWLFRLAGGVVLGCVWCWVVVIFGNVSGRWAMPLAFSSTAVTWMFYLLFQATGLEHQDSSELVGTLTSYAAMSGGMCLFLGEIMCAPAGESGQTPLHPEPTPPGSGRRPMSAGLRD